MAGLCVDAFDDEKRAVPEAPEDEVPARAVPETAQKEDGDEIAVPPRRADAVSTERDIEVVTEPGRQRDVPPSPEVGDGRRDVGPPEVLGEPKPEHPAEADRHVRVAGEIEIDLQRVADEAEPRVRGRQFAERHAEDL